MHICYIMEATAGGSRKHLRYMTEALRQAGHDVDLILSPLLADPDFTDDVELYRQLGCRVWLIDMPKRLSWQDLAVRRRIRRILHERQPDIVHTHCAKAGFIGRLAVPGGTHRPRVVHTPHSYFFEGFKSPWLVRLGVSLERFLDRRTAAVFCISEAERQLIDQHHLAAASRVFVGRNGLPETFHGRLHPRATVRRELELSDETVAVGIFARLVRKKGHLWLLDAIHRLSPQRRARLRLCIYGEGPMQAELERRIEELKLADTVRLMGYVPEAERYLAGMDLAVLPSYYEGLSYQLLEALAAGVPLIATDIPGNRFSFPDNPIVYVEPDRPDDLARRLEDLANNPEQRAELGRRGLEWVRRHLRLDDQVEALLTCYRDILPAGTD